MTIQANGGWLRAHTHTGTHIRIGTLASDDFTNLSEIVFKLLK